MKKISFIGKHAIAATFLLVSLNAEANLWETLSSLCYSLAMVFVVSAVAVSSSPQLLSNDCHGDVYYRSSGVDSQIRVIPAGAQNVHIDSLATLPPTKGLGRNAYTNIDPNGMNAPQLVWSAAGDSLCRYVAVTPSYVCHDNKCAKGDRINFRRDKGHFKKRDKRDRRRAAAYDNSR